MRNLIARVKAWEWWPAVFGVLGIAAYLWIAKPDQWTWHEYVRGQASVLCFVFALMSLLLESFKNPEARFALILIVAGLILHQFGY